MYGENGPALEADLFLVRAASLRARSLASVSSRDRTLPLNTTYLEEIEAEARDLNNALAAWFRSVPSEWKYQISHTNIEVTSTDMFYDNTVYNYTTPAHACIWNRCRAVGLIANSIRFEVIKSLEITSQSPMRIQQQDLCLHQLECLATDMCRSVPSFFNVPNLIKDATGLKSIKLGSGYFSSDCDIFPKLAGLLAWPLTVAVSTSAVPDPPKQWLRRKLKAVAVALGDNVLQSVLANGEFRF